MSYIRNQSLTRNKHEQHLKAEMMKLRYETEGVAKAEELEMAELKLQARLSEAESTAEQLNAKLLQVERTRPRS